ncbi:MAG: hypothetical protein M1831_004904 [Alyxoria varia]|nr:MAG: hypothetical protein M1831_004904 [Alyxoria varia]
MARGCGWSPPPLSVYTSDIVQITVPEFTLDYPIYKPTEFDIPHGLIAYFSAHFDQVVHDDSYGNDPSSLSIEWCRADTLEVVVNWLFTGELKLARFHFPRVHKVGPRPEHRNSEDSSSEADSMDSTTYLDLSELCQVYIFACKIDMPALMNDAISAVHDYVLEKGATELSRSILVTVFSDTLPSSGLRRLLVEMLALHPDVCRSLRDGHPDSDMQDVWEALLDKVIIQRQKLTHENRDAVESSWRDINVCDYHEHSSPEK